MKIHITWRQMAIGVALALSLLYSLYAIFGTESVVKSIDSLHATVWLVVAMWLYRGRSGD